MASVKTVLRKKELSDGSFPICIRVTKDRKTKYFKTLFNATEKEWDSKTGMFKKQNNNHTQNNRLLLKFKDRALQVLAELELNTDGFSLEEFERRFRIEVNPISRNIFAFWDEIIDEMVTAGRTGNARANRDTCNSLKRFLKWSDVLYFEEVTPAFLNKYEVHLRSRGGSDGGIGVRMRAIRAIYNMGIERNLVKESNYPFKSYKISRLKGKGAKRALKMEEVQKIVQLDVILHPHLKNSRNYFVFSFYTQGMNFADMMRLKWENVIGDKIYYKRAKTKGNFVIQVFEPVKEILEEYKGEVNISKYVFPILLRKDMTPPQIENRKHKTLKKYNKDLKEIAVICGIEQKMSSYVARHSFANCLKQKGVATDVISESLGHQNLTITQAYLKELDGSLIDEATRLLVS